MIDFNDLSKADSKSVKLLIDNLHKVLGNQIHAIYWIAVALKVSTPEIRNKFASAMSKDIWCAVETFIDEQRPLRLSEVVVAQSAIMYEANRLYEEGNFRLI